MSRIYINGRFLTRPMTGVERYAYMICKALAEMRTDFTIICPKSPVLSCYDVRNLPIIHYGFGQSHLWEQCVLPFFFIGKKDYMFFSFTGLGSILIRNKIMAIHDLSFLKNPKWFSKGYYWYYRIMTPWAVKTSKHIITVSEFSKKEILRLYPFIKEENISIAYNAVDEKIFNSLPQSPVPAHPFALTVSSLDPRKNFANLIEAFKGIEDCSLYIVGSHNPIFKQEGSMKAPTDTIRFLGRVSDEELVRLYNQATCFIFPSIYEGFGLPTIEAMKCGCPVLVSDIPVLREVCGEAAIYFDPYHIEEIRNTIKQFLKKNEALQSTIIEKGFENVKRFSWEKTAKAIIQLAQQ